MMQQEKIMEPLEEAAKLDCLPERRTTILDAFKDATYAYGHDIDDRATALSYVLFAKVMANSMIFWFRSTIETMPQFLPDFFPIFSSACGDRIEGTTTCDVDWSVVSKKKKRHDQLSGRRVSQTTLVLMTASRRKGGGV